MLPQEIIRKTRSHEKLTAEEIEFFIRGLSRGDIADIQAASFTMAVFLNGLNREETLALTLAMRDSGEKIELERTAGQTDCRQTFDRRRRR